MYPVYVSGLEDKLLSIKVLVKGITLNYYRHFCCKSEQVSNYFFF